VNGCRVKDLGFRVSQSPMVVVRFLLLAVGSPGVSCPVLEAVYIAISLKDLRCDNFIKIKNIFKVVTRGDPWVSSLAM
jgi:hypothetical protein